MKRLLRLALMAAIVPAHAAQPGIRDVSGYSPGPPCTGDSPPLHG